MSSSGLWEVDPETRSKVWMGFFYIAFWVGKKGGGRFTDIGYIFLVTCYSEDEWE